MSEVRYVDNDNREHSFASEGAFRDFIRREALDGDARVKIPERRRVRAYRLDGEERVYLSGFGMTAYVCWHTETKDRAAAAIITGAISGKITSDGKEFELEDVEGQ